MPTPSVEGAVPWPEECAERYVRAGLWAGEPLGDRLRGVAESAPDAIALVDGERRLTHLELAERADATAMRLYGLGLRPDDRIVLQPPNAAEFVVLIYACLRLGVIPVMALPAHRRHEIGYLVAHAEAKALAVPHRHKGFDHQAMATDIAAACPTLAHLLVLGDAVASGSVDMRALCAPPDMARTRRDVDAFRPGSRSVAVLLLSGGTTGLPKLIARTHDDYAFNATRSAQVCDFGGDTVYYVALPIAHNFPLACPGLLGSLLSGGRVVLGSPDPAKAFAAIERERVTVTSVVPAVAQRWLDHRREDSGRDLSSLQVLQVGGARLAEEVARRIRPTLGCTLQQVFGMAEGLLSYTRLDDPEGVILATQGRPMSDHDEILLVDEAGEPVPEGRPGLLLTRGPNTPRGYYRAPEHNAQAFTRDGWYRTGDIVRRRPDGNLIVEGRDKDMINRGGEKISAEEIENFAYQIEGVSLAAAVAMPDSDLGERVCLYVVPKPGRSVSLGDVRRLMKNAGVAEMKIPERLITVESMPLTKIGKIDKKALRADLRPRKYAGRRAARRRSRA